MIDYHYKFWEANKGYEEFQAKVFNIANEYKFFPASADQIKAQFEKESINPKTVKYAFRGEEMVGYVQAKIRDKSKEVHISFPWVIPEIPTHVQDTLFDGMLEYIKKHEIYGDYKIRSNPMAKPQSNLDYLKNKGFKEKNAWKNLFLDLYSVTQAKYDDKFDCRVGTEEDMEELITLVNQDGRYYSQFPNDEAIKAYFMEKVFPIGHLILAYESGSLVGASAPLVLKPTPENEERIILRFTAFKDVKNQEAYIPLLIETAKECLESGYGKDKLLMVYIDDMDSPQEHAKFLDQFTPVKSDTFMFYYYLE